MAHALETDPIGQLEENLQCNVCLEVLKDPRTLPCCHSFCKDCLEGVVQTCRDTAPHGQRIREIPCPSCRATFPLDPDKHVADMPRNHFICNLVKVTAVLDRGIGVPCSFNCNRSCSVARCVTCEKFLCRECLTDHNKFRGNNGHSVLTMKELSKPENRKKIKDKMYCNKHSGMILKIYCETCDQLICRDCMDFKHMKQGDSCFLVEDVATSYKELLASNNKVMEDALTDGHGFVQRLTLTSKQLYRNAENIKKEIVQKKHAVMKTVAVMLEQKTKALLNKLDQILNDKRANLDRQTEETNQFVENIKTSVQLSKKLVDQGTEEEIITSQKMILDNANSLLAKREEYFKASIPVAKLRYTSKDNDTPINEKILRRLTDTLGEVDEESKDTSPKTPKIAEENRKSRRHVKPLTSSIDELHDTPRADQSGRNIEPDESFNISSLFLRYIISYHYEEYQILENVSKGISFEVSESMTDRKLEIFARKDVDKETFSKTVDKFIDFYQNQNQKMLKEIIPKENKDIIFKARTKFSLIIDSTQGNKNKMVIYGEGDKVQEALKFLKNKDTYSTAGNSSAPEPAISERFYTGGHLTSGNDNTGQNVKNCPICLCDITDKKTLDKCGHSFCARCIDEAFKHTKKCPVCSTVYGPLKGNQPKGSMYESCRSISLPGFGSCGSITVSYRFPSGTQGSDHPNPGKPYTGTSLTAYLPDNKEGRKVVNLLRKAFGQKLTFKIIQSNTTGRDDCVILNDIPHKTSMTGGPANSGYPDPDYLRKVQEVLATKGITEPTVYYTSIY